MISGSDSIDSGCRYSLTTINQKGVGPLGSLTVHVSPSAVSNLYGLSQCPACPIFPSLYTKMGEFGGKLYTASVLGPFCIFRASITWRLAYSL